jgi:hypothetical protein
MSPAASDTTLSPATACAFATALSTPSVTNVNGASGWDSTHSVGTRCVTTRTASPTGGVPPHPSVRSNSRRPTTPGPTSLHADRRYSALAAETRYCRVGSLSWNATSPLRYQSNSGPTPPDGYAMNPSSDIDACTTTFPMVVPSWSS